MDTGLDKQSILHQIDMINTIAERVDYITFLDVGVPEAGDIGYSLVDRALKYLYKQYEHSPSACEYVLTTNGDNFYSSELSNNVVPYMNAKKDIIAWDFVTRYGGPKCVPVKLETKRADLGTVAYRIAFLKQHKLYFSYLNRPYDVTSDGYFVEIAASLANTTVLLRQTLFIHQ
jgi:hypothetical protein